MRDHKNKTGAIKHAVFRGHSEHGSQGFYSLFPFWAIILPSLSANSAPFFTLFLWPLNGIFGITQFHSIYNGSDSLPGFLNTSLVSSIFALCVKWNTLYQDFFTSLPKTEKEVEFPGLIRGGFRVSQVIRDNVFFNYHQHEIEIKRLIALNK